MSGSDWSKSKIADHLLARDPSCVIVPAYGIFDPHRADPPGELMHPIWPGVYEHPAFKDRYRCVFSASIHDTKHLYFFVAKEIECEPPDSEFDSSTQCLTVHVY